MVTVRYDTYGIFYIPVNFAFNLPHYVTSYMHHTGKKESEKEKEKNNVTIILLQKDSNPDPPNTLELKMNSAIDWATPVSVDNGCLKPQIRYFILTQ